MSQPEQSPVQIKTTISDASDLPMHHVNVMNLRATSDEFYFTLGVIAPPEADEMAEIIQAGHIKAKPVFRFAISRDTMEQFLALMAGQFDQQTRLINELRKETNKEEVNGNG